MKHTRGPTKESRDRYAAKLLFQFRVARNGRSSKRRACEERIVILRARSDRSAIALAQTRGRRVQFDYPSAEGARVFFEFIGVLDMIRLGVECEPDEVWYDIREMIAPMERRKKIVPPEHRLLLARGFAHRGGQFVRDLAPAVAAAHTHKTWSTT